MIHFSCASLANSDDSDKEEEFKGDWWLVDKEKKKLKKNQLGKTPGLEKKADFHGQSQLGKGLSESKSKNHVSPGVGSILLHVNTLLWGKWLP